MAIFDFIKNMGKTVAANVAAAGKTPDQQLQEQEDALKSHVAGAGINIQNLDLKMAGDGDVVLTGTASTRADAEKAALFAGNVVGISRVDNQITVTNDEGASGTYTVKSGDTLSKIAKEVLGDAGKYNAIFEANKPMLSDPDEIYAGQVLRIPQA